MGCDGEFHFWYESDDALDYDVSGGCVIDELDDFTSRGRTASDVADDRVTGRGRRHRPCENDEPDGKRSM